MHDGQPEFNVVLDAGVADHLCPHGVSEIVRQTQPTFFEDADRSSLPNSGSSNSEDSSGYVTASELDPSGFGTLPEQAGQPVPSSVR